LHLLLSFYFGFCLPVCLVSVRVPLWICASFHNSATVPYSPAAAATTAARCYSNLFQDTGTTCRSAPCIDFNICTWKLLEDCLTPLHRPTDWLPDSFKEMLKPLECGIFLPLPTLMPFCILFINTIMRNAESSFDRCCFTLSSYCIVGIDVEPCDKVF